MTRNSLLALAAAVMSAGNAAAEVDSERLAAVLAAEPEAVQARYEYRNPQETLEFFGVAPGMTVVEALPGGGWYTQILLPYLGAGGTLIGADYSDDMYPLFGFFSDEQLAENSQFTATFPVRAEDWRGEDGAAVAAFKFGLLADDLEGTADAVLFIRALHNLARFEGQGEFLTTALQDAFDVLKPGGIVGVVQHEARPEKSDEFAGGGRGYLKKSFVIDAMTDAGFEFVAESDVNQNENDQPGDEDIVWRLPPTLIGSRDDPEKKAAMEAVGESNRMTLLFRKP